MSDEYLMRFADGPLVLKSNIQTLSGSKGNFSIPTDLFGWPLPDRLGVLHHDAAPQVAFWDADDPDKAELPTEITESPNAVIYAKVRESQIPAEQAALMTHVVTGAEYRLEEAE